MAPESVIGDDPEQQLRRACNELRERLRAGESCRSEDFLESRPSLSSNPIYAFELILTELSTRHELGQTLDPASWCSRFPRWRDQIDDWFRRQGLVADSVLHDPLTVKVEQPTADRTASAVPLVRARLGRYEVIDTLGRGAMGVVYKARDTLLGRIVALKTIRGGRLAQPEEIERFFQEARAAAKLHHPHVIPLYDFDVDQEQQYFTMAFAAGGSLVRRRELFGADPQATSALMEKIARAVHYLHSKGILHRDLKPGNIMLDERGEPLVSDFGLAKLLDVDAELTQVGTIVGTPAYMAPELATAQPGHATVRSDVWSLGVMLYELLTGQRPFAGQGGKEVAHSILLTDPVRPRTLCPRLDRALETVVLKCLEKKPEKRYGSAEELADDLGRWQRGEPIHARPAGWVERAWRWARCRSSLIIGLLLLGAVAVTAVALWPRTQPSTKAAPSADEARAEALERITRDLAAGKAVTLIGESGQPEYYRFRTETTRPPLAPPGPGPFALESFGQCLFELVPKPQQDSYRITARIKFHGNNEGLAGLYFMGEERATPKGPEHVFLALTFAGTRVLDDKVRLQAFLYREATPAEKEESQHIAFSQLPLTREDWHDLSVEVRPDSIAAACDGKAFAKLTRASAREQVGGWWIALRALGKVFTPPPTLASRASLGIFIRRGTAQIKNFVITPLEAQKSK
jgi:tRNA A-37 threonylcarbamoyl transferase component Bud32